MIPKISLIHASFKSLNQGKRVRDIWIARATLPRSIEHCLGFQSDDLEVINEFGLDLSNSKMSRDGISKCISTVPGSDSSAVRNWNAAASISKGEILFPIADDTIPEFGWDIEIQKLFTAYPVHSPTMCKISDNRCEPIRKKDGLLPRHPVMNRALYNQLGYIFNPTYSGGGPDDELLIMGLQDNFIVDGREFRIHHSYGHIFQGDGVLNCGCGDRKNSSHKNLSQKQIEFEGGNYTKLVQEWGKSWVFIYQKAANPKWSSFILETRQKVKAKRVNSTFFLLLLALRFPLALLRNIFFSSNLK